MTSFQYIMTVSDHKTGEIHFLMHTHAYIHEFWEKFTFKHTESMFFDF